MRSRPNAVTVLGMTNTRARDFFDVWVLLHDAAPDGTRSTAGFHEIADPAKVRLHIHAAEMFAAVSVDAVDDGPVFRPPSSKRRARVVERQRDAGRAAAPSTALTGVDDIGAEISQTRELASLREARAARMLTGEVGQRRTCCRRRL
jgi:hypothetical protein